MEEAFTHFTLFTLFTSIYTIYTPMWTQLIEPYQPVGSELRWVVFFAACGCPSGEMVVAPLEDRERIRWVHHGNDHDKLPSPWPFQVQENRYF